MKARLKGSNDEFKEVLSLKLSDGYFYHIHRLEFEQDRLQESCEPNPEKDLSNPIDHWQDVRERAAIAAMKGVMNFFGSLDYDRETIAELAVKQADALVERLKGE